MSRVDTITKVKVPLSVFGTGLLSSPFLKIGQVFDNFNVPSGDFLILKS